MPGVSTRITCDEPIKAMPRTGPRVVCALWVTIETLAPTSALVSVDLPLFGAPISATKPQRVGGDSSAAGSAILSPRLPKHLAQQHGKRRGLLGLSLIGPLPALRRDAFDLHLGGETRRVIGALATHLEIARQRQAASLRPFLQQGFRIRRGKLEGMELRLPETPHHLLGGLVAGIGEHRAEHGLAGIGEDGLLAAAAASRLAAAHPEGNAPPPMLCGPCGGVPRDHAH